MVNVPTVHIWKGAIVAVVQQRLSEKVCRTGHLTLLHCPFLLHSQQGWWKHYFLSCLFRKNVCSQNYFRYLSIEL